MLYTLVDFITHVKGIEYVMCLTSIAGFLILWEVLKPKPFATVKKVATEDLTEVKKSDILKTLAKIATAPFVGLAYIVALPIGFFVALLAVIVNALVKVFAKNATFAWNPIEAYFAGRKKK